MKKAVSTAGVLIVAGLGAYVYALNDQISDIREVCSLFAEGAPKGDLFEIETEYSVRLMGLSKVNDKPGTERAIFCATLTMCDTSCSVEIQNDRVTKTFVSNM